MKTLLLSLTLVLALPVAAHAGALSGTTDRELAALSADPDWVIRADALLEAAHRTNPDGTASRLQIAPLATRAGFLRFPTEAMHVPEAVPAVLVRLRAEPSAAIRGALADCLVRHAGEWGDAVLDLLAHEAEPTVRAILVFAIPHLSPSLAQDAITVGLGDASPLVRAQVARLVPSRADGGAFAASLAVAMGDVDPEVRAMSARALGIVKSAASAPALQALLTDASGEVRLHALRALDRIDGAAAKRLPTLPGLAQDADPRVARKAAAILAR